MTKDYPWGKGTPTWVRDATLNDSDKSFSVPVGKMWKILGMQHTLTTSATVGNRTLTVIITNGTDQVWRVFQSTSLQAASTTYQYFIVPGNPALTGAAGGPSSVLITMGPVPDELLLPAGYVVRVYDFAAIDAAADDLTVVLHYVEYDA